MNPITTARTVARCFTRRITFPLALVLLAGGAAPAMSQIVAFTNNPVTTTYGGASDNGPGLNIGDSFNVSAGNGIEVLSAIAYFDWQGDGLAASRTP